MKKLLSLALSLSLAGSLAFAAPPASKAAGIDSKDYKWNAPEVEKTEALKIKGDVNRGKKAYEICTACHTEDWFSHRAEKGKTGRFGALIGL